MNFGPILRARFFGDYACFNGPKKDEPTSYPVPTPSAFRGLLETVLWKPAFFWYIRRIYVLNPIRWFNMKVNEVKEKCSLSGRSIVVDDPRVRVQRNIHGLRDVDYVVEASIILTQKRGPGENVRKFVEMFERRLRKGQCHSMPFMGRSDFVAYFEPAPEHFSADESLTKRTIDLGMILLDRHYGEKVVEKFFHAELKGGAVVEKGKDELPFFIPSEECA